MQGIWDVHHLATLRLSLAKVPFATLLSALEQTLNQGDLIILTSDGVIEAKNEADELFGFDRLEQVAANGPADSAVAMLAHLQAEVTAFVQDRPPHDDLTIVVVKV